MTVALYEYINIVNQSKVFLISFTALNAWIENNYNNHFN